VVVVVVVTDDDLEEEALEETVTETLVVVVVVVVDDKLFYTYTIYKIKNKIKLRTLCKSFATFFVYCFFNSCSKIKLKKKNNNNKQYKKKKTKGEYLMQLSS
jgi:hypothetical protein